MPGVYYYSLFVLNLEINILLFFFLKGAVVTAKAALSESSDNTNQAIAMAVITSSFSTGSVIGPALSGAIADPVGQYNLTIASKLLHNDVVSVCVCVCVCVCVFVCVGG